MPIYSFLRPGRGSACRDGWRHASPRFQLTAGVTDVAVDENEERLLLSARVDCAIFLKPSRRKCKLALVMICC